MNATEGLTAAVLPALFPAPVITEEVRGGPLAYRLHPDEERCVRRAIAKRRNEFAAGRLCAQRALERLGIRDFPLVAAPDRAPVWPAGVVGSISHAPDYCGVAVAERGAVRGLGLDIELAERLVHRLWTMACTPREVAWLREQAEGEQVRAATLLFSAKECFYKCQYPLTRRWLGYREAEVLVDLGRATFRVEPLVADRPLPGATRDWRGRFLFRYGYVFTGMTFGDGAADASRRTGTR